MGDAAFAVNAVWSFPAVLGSRPLSYSERQAGNVCCRSFS